jgi:predicted DNA-binding helix-hairpin-helix protein
MLLEKEMDVNEKLSILSDAAKYDVACTSSGVDRSSRVVDWGIQKPVVYVIHFLLTEDVFLF